MRLLARRSLASERRPSWVSSFLPWLAATSLPLLANLGVGSIANGTVVRVGDRFLT